MLKFAKSVMLCSTALLVACVHIPSGPSVLVLPGSGKTFEQFRNDDYLCKQYAAEQVSGRTPRQAAITSGMETAALGAALGAAAGVAIGGGEGAAIGAGTGLLAGALGGSSSAQTSGYLGQQRYDMGYLQCMYANGHRIPSPGRFATEYTDGGSNRYPPPPPPRTGSGKFQPPPPPPGNPPPPPPGY